MTAFEIGVKVADLCRQGKNIEAIKTFYANDAMSVESMENSGVPRTQTGLDKILEKNQWWMDNHEIHSAAVTGPFPHGNDKFALMFAYDVTFTPDKKRMKMEEIAVYTLENKKIVKEEFFYHMG